MGVIKQSCKAVFYFFSLAGFLYTEPTGWVLMKFIPHSTISYGVRMETRVPRALLGGGRMKHGLEASCITNFSKSGLPLQVSTSSSTPAEDKEK